MSIFERAPWERVGVGREPTGWRKLEGRTFYLPDGREKTYDVVVSRDSASVLPVTKDEKVVLVKQFRPGPEQFLLEVPGGVIERGDTAWETAGKELQEETGYSGTVVSTGCILNGAYTTGRKYTFLAYDCVRTGVPRPDDTEFVEPVLVTLTEFYHMIREGQVLWSDVVTGYRGLDKYAQLSKERFR